MRIEPITFPEFKITKGGMINFSRIVSIFFIFALYIISDFMASKMRGSFVTDTAYWVTTLINLVLIISIMLTVRAMRKDSQLNNDKPIKEYMSQIEKGFKKITSLGLSDNLENYLETLNNENKYNEFIRQIQNKLMRLNDKKFFFSKKNAIKYEERIKEKRTSLNNMLKIPKEEVLKMNVQFKRVTFSKLFSSVDGKIINANEFDLDTYESTNVAKMVGFKALIVFLFSAFSTTIVVEFYMSGISVLFGVLIKIFSLLLAVNTAMSSADSYVEHNLKISVFRRFKILSNYVKVEPQLNNALEDKKPIENNIEDKKE